MREDVGDRLIEFLKACKTNPAPINDLRIVTGWSRSNTWRWAKKLLDNGIIEEVEMRKTVKMPGKAWKGYKVSRAWGGQ